MKDNTVNYQELAKQIKTWGKELGFSRVGISRMSLDGDAAHLKNWLNAGRHGAMDYMARHVSLRERPDKLLTGTLSVISVAMDYWNREAASACAVLERADLAYIARYALGRDYHRVIRQRLHRLATRIVAGMPSLRFRVFTDSAPVLEKALARNAGLGWIGKHTNLIHKEAGSWFFLGEIYTDLPLPSDLPFQKNHCGSCVACMQVCPTAAIIAPYQLDARRCISYLTIEWSGRIPEELRSPIGNRIFGCDDCQLVCPWNRHAEVTQIKDFSPRHYWDASTLLQLFSLNNEEYLQKTEGMALRRAGYIGWLRNIAVALGNAPTTTAVMRALEEKRVHSHALVAEHATWALAQHQGKRGETIKGEKKKIRQTKRSSSQ